MIIKTTKGDFNVTAKFVDTVYGFPFDETDSTKMYHDQYRIMVNKDGKRAFFYWYQSAHDTQKGVEFSDHKFALWTMFDDGYSGADSFSEFCSSIGYDEDSRRAEKIYKACQRLTEKCYRFVDSLDDIADLVNELND